MLDKLENFQKRCIKWILSEEFYSYGCYEEYLRKCCQVNILPLAKHFDYNDLTLFFKIIHSLVPLKLPDYLKFFDGNSRLRKCHLDRLNLVSSIMPNCNVISETNKNSALYKSFYYRVHLLWNELPFEIRECDVLSTFQDKLVKFLWQSTKEESDNYVDTMDNFYAPDDTWLL